MKSIAFPLQAKNTLLWNVLFLLALVSLLVLKFGYHELWKDEWQAYLMARDMGWGELLAALYYEGHPAIWYLYLKAWTGLGDLFAWTDAFTLTFGHAMIVVIAGGVFWRFSSLNPILKLAFFLGYHLFFEYGIVNRGYVFILLFGVLLVWELAEERRRPFYLASLFFLLCQTEVYGVLIAGSLLFYYFLDVLYKRLPIVQTLLTPAVGALLGLAVFVLTVYPRASQDELASAYEDAPFSTETVSLAFQGTLANTYWLGSIPDTNVNGISTLGIVFSMLLLAGIIYLFWSDRRVLGTFLFFQLTVFLFSSLIYVGGVRQWGAAILALLFFLQLLTYHQSHLSLGGLLVIGSILGFQLYYNGLALQKEIVYPFSNAVLAGEFIQEKVPDNVPIVAINKFEAAPVVGYAGRPFYALPDGESFTYFKWVEKIYLPPEGELRLFAQFKKVGGIIVLSPKPLDRARYPSLQPWQTFTEYNIKNENYYLYTLSLDGKR